MSSLKKLKTINCKANEIPKEFIKSLNSVLFILGLSYALIPLFLVTTF